MMEYDYSRELANVIQSQTPSGLPSVTLKEDLHRQKAKAEAGIARLNELIDLLEAHPEVKRALDLLRQCA